MISLFPPLRVAEAVLCALDILLVFALYSRGAGWVWALAALPVILLGARLAAVLRHQKIINLLYKKLDPDRFIGAYEPLLARASGKPKLESTLRNFLSTGYASRGDFEKAIAILEATPPVEGPQAVRGQALKLVNLCNVYLMMGDTAEAEELLRRLEALLARDEQGQAGRDMPGNVNILRNYVRAARGWEADEDFLARLALRSAEPYDQLNNRYQLALAQLGAHKRASARENLRRVAETAPRLYIGREAARRLAQLNQEDPAGEEAVEKPPQTQKVVYRPFLKK